MLISLLVFLLILSVLVFVHELGHFMVAKWSGMRVDEFAIGFPPRLWTRRRGETLYSINAIPLGGYVRIHGESNPGSDEDSRSFQNRPILARIAVVVAGVCMNLLFAFIVLTIAFSVGFVSVGQQLDTVPGAVIEKSDVYVLEVLSHSAAETAHIQSGEMIRSFRDTQTGEVTKITSAPQLQEYTRSKRDGGHPNLIATIQHENQIREVPVTLSATGAPLGVSIDALNQIRVPVWRAPGVALKEIGFIIGATWDALAGFGKQLIHAHLDRSVSGPVGIYRATDSATRQGIVPVVFLMVALSVNLALLNILPIPALDGGKLVFLLIEMVVRKRVVSLEIENIVSIAGMMALLGLIAIITLRDVGLF